MVTGKKAFEGKTQASVIAAILEREPPPISSLQPMVPGALDRAVKTCLAKDRDERWQTAHDVKLQLQWVAKGGSQAGASALEKKGKRPVVYLLGGLLLGSALVAGAAALFRAKPTPAPVVRFTVAVPTGHSVDVGSPPQFALSPDGSKLAYVSTNLSGGYELYLRTLDSDEAKVIPSTGCDGNPFFSPDGDWVGLYSYSSNRLEKVALWGGSVQPLCKVAGESTATWLDNGEIIFASTGQGLFRIPSAGGTPEPIGKPRVSGEFLRNAPEVLPGGKAILFVGNASQSDIVALDLDTHTWRTILEQGENPHYLEPGYIVFGRSGSIWAAPFDASRLKLTGQPVLVVDGVLAERPGIGVEQFAVSKNGTLAYLTGTGTEVQRQVVLGG